MAVPPNEVQCETLSVLHDLKTSFAQLYGDIESYRTHAQGIETRIADCRDVLRQLNVDPRACEASTSPVPSRSAAPGSAHAAAGGSSPGPASPAAAAPGGTVLSPGTLLERDVNRTLAETERLLVTADSLAAHTTSEQQEQQQQQQQQEFEELALSTWERDVLSDPATPRDNAGEAAAAAPILLNVSSTSTAGGGVGGIGGGGGGGSSSGGGVPGVRTSCASSAATRPQESPTLAPLSLAPAGSSPATSPRSSKAGSPKTEKKEKKEKKASGKEKDKNKKEKKEEKPTSPRAASPKAASSPNGGSKADKAAEKLDKQLDKEIEKLLADGVWKTKQDDRGQSYYYLAASKKTRVWNLKKHLMQEREAKAGGTSLKASSSHQAKAQ